MFASFFELIYPRRCAICGQIVTPKGYYVHEECRKRLHFVTEPRCARCGKPLLEQEQEYCYDCSKKNFHYQKGFSLVRYDDLMKHSIAEFKYNGKKEYADFYVTELLDRYGQDLTNLQLDCIVPVPIHSSKRLGRGFNQAGLIAVGLGKGLFLPVIEDLLIRNKKTLPQKQLNDKERLANLSEAFEMNSRYDLRGINKVLIVDDIYTTGSTIEACTKILSQAGISQVYFITVCIGQGF